MAKKALRKFWKKENKGFTLVELIIVIAIIAILVAILVPNYVRYVEKSRWNNDQNQMETLVGEVNTAITETMEKGDEVLGTAGTNGTITKKDGTAGTTAGTNGTITITKKDGTNDTITLSGFTDAFMKVLNTTDKNLSFADGKTSGKGVYLKNNGNHPSANQSEGYLITVSQDADGNVKAEGKFQA